MISFCYFTRNRLEKLKESVISLEQTCGFEDPDIFIVEDNSYDEYRCRFDPVFNKKNIRVFEVPVKNSCAELLNYCLMFSKYQYVCMISDDIKFLNSKWIDEIRKLIYFDKPIALVFGPAMWYFDKKVIPDIGWFDERFLSGGLEDTDRLARLNKKNIHVDCMENILLDSISHVQGHQHESSIWHGEHKNGHSRKFYIQKWGSINHPIAKNQEQLIDDIDWHPRQTQFYKHAFKEKKLIINDSVSFIGKKDNLYAYKCKLECGHYANFATKLTIPKDMKCPFCGTDNFR